MTISLVFMTYNRLEYTRLSLPRLLADPSEEFGLTIWDNGSTDGTQDYLREVKDRRIVDIVFSPTNRGQAHVTNKVWGESTADLLGKIDNDCLVTPGWTRKLAQAHQDIDNLGVVGCWHFFPGDFDYERAQRKIQQFGKHQLLRHPWIDGSALLVKRRVYEHFAPCREHEYLTRFWVRLALAGYINGYYYPFIYQEHMDDPVSKHSMLKDDATIDKLYKVTYTLHADNIRTVEEYLQRREVVLHNLLCDPWEVKYYVGWRRRLRSLKSRFHNLVSSTLSPVGANKRHG